MFFPTSIPQHVMIFSWTQSSWMQWKYLIAGYLLHNQNWIVPVNVISHRQWQVKYVLVPSSKSRWKCNCLSGSSLNNSNNIYYVSPHLAVSSHCRFNYKLSVFTASISLSANQRLQIWLRAEVGGIASKSECTSRKCRFHFALLTFSSHPYAMHAVIKVMPWQSQQFIRKVTTSFRDIACDRSTCCPKWILNLQCIFQYPYE